MNEPITLRRLFEQALALPVEQRTRYLRDQCSDPDLRQQVARLLAADTDGLDPLPEASADDLSAAIGEDNAPVWSPGQQIGGWTLQARLGEGGSATVFRASRDVEGTPQQVAIKLLHRSVHSPGAQRQFRRERQALAALHHPNIAQLIDGGVTTTGTPYLVMTLVEGLPITDHANDAQLGLRARLALMGVVCRAVASAHRNLIVHRDLKPANILVTHDGTVQLLDFGIAKLLDADEALSPDATRTGYAPLTPGYAAPEQYAGGRISTATDVYALGVVLHELLLGVRPARERPQRPSLRLETLKTDLWQLPASRPALRAALRGDLDNIVLKALADEPERRYAGASDLADDLERHLSARPVHAHPPSRWYRTRKFVQRHRGGVMVTAALSLGLLASLGVALWQAMVARQQAHAATTQTQRAEAINTFLVGLFDNQIPLRPGEATPGTDVLLERGVQQALTALDDQPGLQASLLVALARVYDHLARGDDALPLLDQAIVAARSVQPADPQLLGRALSERGALDLQMDRYPQALAWFEQALALQTAHNGDPLQQALTLDRQALANSRLGRHDEALAGYRRSLALREQHLPDDDPEIIHTHHAIGTTLIRANRGDEAEPWMNRADSAASARFGEDHVKTAHYRKNRAVNLLYRGQLGAGLPMLEQAVAMERRLYPSNHPDRGQGLNNLGSNLWLAGRLDDAGQALEEGIALLRDAGQDEGMGMGYFLGNLSRVAEARGQIAQARALCDDALRITRRLLDESHERITALRLQQARLHALADPADDSREHLAVLVDAIIAGELALGQFRERSLIEARHARAWLLDQRGDVTAANESRRLALADAPAWALDPFLFQDAATLAAWWQAQGEAAEASTLIDTWLARAQAQQLPADHFALTSLHRLATEHDRGNPATQP